jgi:hypothetical protein
MQFAKVQQDGIKLTGQGWALLLAIVAIIPAAVTAGIELFLTRPAAIRVENAKLDLERRKTATALYQATLTDSDPAKRKKMLSFLVDGGVLRDDNNTIRSMTADNIPQWAPAASEDGP